jgi:predicted nucleic acid-binding protein
MWLVDSARFIDWLRRGRNPTPLLRPYLLAGQLATCGVVRVEVLRGVIKPAPKAELGSLFDAMLDIPVTAAVWDQIAELVWRLDRAGQVLPISDLIVAGCALRAGATVVSQDPHFGRIPGLTVRADLPPMPFP